MCCSQANSNIKHQQNLGSCPIAIVILRALNNRLKTHIPVMPEVGRVLLTIRPGQLVEIAERRIRSLGAKTLPED
jgi:hypothetical protein